MTVDGRGNEERIGRRMNRVTDGMMGSVIKRKRIVEDCMFATNAERRTGERTARVESESMLKRPKYMERSVWTDANATDPFSPTASCTLTDEPLPRPPFEEFSNREAIKTIHDNRHLFKIVTPINVK